MIIYSVGNTKWNKYVDLTDNLRKSIHIGDQLNETSNFNDCTGESISYKNDMYSELTALYWIWKNSKEDIIGIEHYRRLFLNSKNENDPLLQKDIVNLLSSYDMIIPNKHIIKNTIISSEIMPFMPEVLKEVLDIIQILYPSYFSVAKYIMENYKWYIHCNMMICKKEIFDDYCKWLFDILFILEENFKNKYTIEKYSRLYGFISEHIFIIWLAVNKIKCIEKPIVMYNKNVNAIWHYE